MARLRSILIVVATGLAACATIHDVRQQSDGTYVIEAEDGKGLTSFAGLLNMDRRQASRFCERQGKVFVEGRERHEGAMFIMGTASELAFQCVPTVTPSPSPSGRGPG